MIAHRGASCYAPENTMAAFRMAYEMGAGMIELDVTLSKDQVPVVFHDSKINRVTNGRGELSSFTFDELRELDAGAKFSDKYRGEKIPALSELLKWAAGKITLNIEIKPEAVSNRVSGGIEEKVIGMVKGSGMEKHVVLSSFSYEAVGRFKQIAPDIPTGLLYHKEQSDGLGPVRLLEKYKADLFHCSKRELSRKWMIELKKENRKMMVYTVNRKREMKRLIEMGVFGIFSDRPDLLKNVVAESFPAP